MRVSVCDTVIYSIYIILFCTYYMDFCYKMDLQ